MQVYYILVIVVLLVLLLISRIRRGKSEEGEELVKTRTANEQLRIELARTEERVAGLNTEKENLVAFLTRERDRLQLELEKERQKLAEVNQSYDSTRSYLKAQQEKIAEQKLEIEKMHEKFNKDFQILATSILEEKTNKFTEVNKTNLEGILTPLRENLKTFEEKVNTVYRTESAERNILKGELSKLMELNKQISEEANNLTRALRTDNKKQGNWGEFVLDKILEASGLTEGDNYIKQFSIADEQGNRLQPDIVITLPDNKHLIIDSKVSLIAYDRLMNCESDEERPLYLKEHIASIRNHIKNLASKNYYNLYGINSPDFVLLFIPIESSFAIAVQHDMELFEFGWNKRVVIVTPSTLLATLKTVSAVWRQELQTRNAIEIANKAGALYDKFVSFIYDLNKIGENLDKSREAYTQAFSKLSSGNGNLIGKVESLRKLGAKATKQLDKRYISEDN